LIGAEEEAVIDPHPSEAELLEIALDESSTDARATMLRHVGGCDICRGVIDMLRAQATALRFVSRTGTRTEHCLDEESIAGIAEGNVDPIGSPSIQAHVLGCARCAHELAGAARLLEDGEVRRALDGGSADSGDAQRRRRLVIGGLSVAAAAVLILALRPPLSSKVAKPTYREESVTSVAAPVPISPLGVTAAPDTFRWTAVPRADRYRLTVFDRGGSVVWETITRDTAVAQPDLLWQSANGTYLWRVEARVGWEDRWAASDLATLTTRRSSAR
jgi:hypothetical protein